MTQSQLNREVAKAIGESVGLVRHRGFSFVSVPQPFGQSTSGNRHAKSGRKGVSRSAYRKAA